MIFIGALLGDITFMETIIKEKQNCKNFIQLGNLQKEEYENIDLTGINKALSENSQQLYLLRGNRDKPENYDGNLKSFENITFVKDNSLLNIEDKEIFFIGGALSTDTNEESKQINMRSNDKIIFDFKKLKQIENIDIVVSHLSPPFLFPEYEEIAANDPVLQNSLCLCRRLEEQQAAMRKLRRIITKSHQIDAWLSGHYTKDLENTDKNILYKNIGEKRFFHPLLGLNFAR